MPEDQVVLHRSSGKRQSWIQRNTAILSVAVPTLFLFCLGIFPLLYSVWMSLNWWPMIPYRPRFFVGFGNYITLLLDPDFAKSLRITLTYVGVSVGLEFLIGLGLAMAMRAESGVISHLRVLFSVPILMAPVAVGLTFRFLYNPLYGPLSIIFDSLGMGVKWMSPSTALASVIVADVWQWMPFMFLVLLSGILSVPRQHIEAAQVDGASRWQEFKYVILPWLKPIAIILILLRGTAVFGELDKIYVITRGGPGLETSTMVFDAYEQGFVARQLGMATAICFLIVIIVNVFYAIFSRYMEI